MADGEVQVQGKLEHEAVANGETVNDVIEEADPVEETSKKKKKKKKKNKSAASGWNYFRKLSGRMTGRKLL